MHKWLHVIYILLQYSICIEKNIIPAFRNKLSITKYMTEKMYL